MWFLGSARAKTLFCFSPDDVTKTLKQAMASRACRDCLPLMAVAAAWLPAVGAFSSSCPSGLVRGPLATARRARCGAAASGVLGLRADVTVSLPTPLGIVFEEVEPGANKGLVVADLVWSPRACARLLLSRGPVFAQSTGPHTRTCIRIFV